MSKFDAMTKRKTPKYVETYDKIINIIIDKKLKYGDRIPSEHYLSSLLNISRGTVRQALALLREDGIIYHHQGKGNFLTKNNISKMGGLEKLSLPFYDFNNEAYTKIEITAERQQITNKMKDYLNKEEDTTVILFNYKYYIADKIVALVMYFICYEDLPDFNQLLSENQIINMVDGYIKDNVISSELYFNAVDIRTSIASKMNKSHGEIVMFFSEIMHSPKGEGAVYRKAYLDPEYYNFKIIRSY